MTDQEIHHATGLHRGLDREDHPRLAVLHGFINGRIGVNASLASSRDHRYFITDLDPCLFTAAHHQLGAGADHGLLVVIEGIERRTRLASTIERHIETRTAQAVGGAHDQIPGPQVSVDIFPVHPQSLFIIEGHFGQQHIDHHGRDGLIQLVKQRAQLDPLFAAAFKDQRIAVGVHYHSARLTATAGGCTAGGTRCRTLRTAGSVTESLG